MTILVTGGAGFIGSHLTEALIAEGHHVVVVDSFDAFYDPALKWRNLDEAVRSDRCSLIATDVRDLAAIEAALEARGHTTVDAIVHLAARAGVRPSIEDPLLYTQVNVEGTMAVLELARRWGVSRLVFGSSSSVYGNNPRVPFSEADAVDTPISPYAATKRAGELLCHAHHHLFGLSVVCLRFFTVYGPRQRPDLAIHKFARRVLSGEPIPMFGDGSTERDYTYIDDILQGILGALAYTEAHPGDFQIVNLGESRTTPLRRLIALIGESLGREPRIERHPPQPGDVERTFADVSKARALLDYRPRVAVEEGIPRFCRWLVETVEAEAAVRPLAPRRAATRPARSTRRAS